MRRPTHIDIVEALRLDDTAVLEVWVAAHGVEVNITIPYPAFDNRRLLWGMAYVEQEVDRGRVVSEAIFGDPDYSTLDVLVAIVAEHFDGFAKTGVPWWDLGSADVSEGFEVAMWDERPQGLLPPGYVRVPELIRMGVALPTSAPRRLEEPRVVRRERGYVDRSIVIPAFGEETRTRG